MRRHPATRPWGHASGCPLVLIAILGCNRRDDTLACLTSLRRLDYPNHHLVAVDDGEADNSAAAIRAAHPQLTILGTGKSLSFGEAGNLGLDHARVLGAEYTLLLRNDTQVARDALELLVAAAQADPRVALAGPTIYCTNRPDLIWAAGGAIDWKRGNARVLEHNETDRGQLGEVPWPVDFVPGCAMLLRMAVLDRAGGIDSRFLAPYGEAEWCARIRRAGYKVIQVPAAKVWHNPAPEERAEPLAAHYHEARNRLLFLRASRAGWHAWAYTLLLDYPRTLLGRRTRSRQQGRGAARRPA